MGREEGRSLAKHKVKEEGEGTWPASAVAVPKVDGEWEPQPGWSRNGARWLAMGQLQITAISRQLSQEELVFVLVVWLYIPEVWLSFFSWDND